MPTTVDVIVIGLGPGGETAAGQLAEAGLNVVGIEGGLVGGECPYWGCIPSKMMIRAANSLAEARRVARAGRRPPPSPRTGGRSPSGSETRPPTTGTTPSRWTVSWERAVTSCAATPGSPRPAPSRSTTTPYVASRRIVIATGTLAAVPPIPGLADTPYWTNHDVMRGQGAAPVVDRARRRRHRHRVGPGDEPLRRRRHRRRGRKPGCSRAPSPRPATSWPRSSPPRGSPSTPVSSSIAWSTPTSSSS